MLTQILDTSSQRDLREVVPVHFHCFTDGSCLKPTQPWLRLATWAVCAPDETTEQHVPVAAGGLRGPLQTILRAELTAAMAAMWFCGLTTYWFTGGFEITFKGCHGASLA